MERRSSKDFYYYGCKHRSMIRGHKCDYKKQIREELLDNAVAEVIVKLAEEIDSLDPDDRHYVRCKTDLDDRLYRMYDKIEDTESLLIAAKARKQAIEAEKLTGNNIYKVLIYFDKLYDVMNEQEQRQIMETLISERVDMFVCFSVL